MSKVSRRYFLGAASSVALANAMAIKKEDKSALPVISKRVEKVFLAPGQHPNDLETVTDGLWILDQADPNKAHKVSWDDGKVLAEVQTEAMHGSGIAFYDNDRWIAATASGPCPTCLSPL